MCMQGGAGQTGTVPDMVLRVLAQERFGANDMAWTGVRWMAWRPAMCGRTFLRAAAELCVQFGGVDGMFSGPEPAVDGISAIEREGLVNALQYAGPTRRPCDRLEGRQRRLAST